MPSLVHETVVDGLEALIADSIDRAAGRRWRGRYPSRHFEKTKAELGKVWKGRSGVVDLIDSEGERTRREPDGTFYHPAQPSLPTLVLEVAYSQSQPALSRLAERYLLDSGGGIRCVVGLDLPFPLQVPSNSSSDATATLSIWRLSSPGSISRIDHSFPFHDPDASAFVSPIRLSATDVLPASALPKCAFSAVEMNIPILIPISSLAAIVQSAANRAHELAASPQRLVASSPPTAFRKRSTVGCVREVKREKRSPAQRRMTDFCRVGKGLREVKVKGWVK
ncbi:uncharacterized protein LTR77_010351 [Saxophila tyrrhenica]|uniref:Restriction endonuclease domain-containing protein n=1 Tax=Saxophila tyrrhenica TaxID=1690608 RepID=A0AAV9NWT4_9PEZI|nr:hypothetical protein LTR77_010351 [Saxophila tyrrhenica]